MEVTVNLPTHPDESQAYSNRCVDGSYCTLTQMSLTPIATGVDGSYCTLTQMSLEPIVTSVWMEVTVHSPR